LAIVKLAKATCLVGARVMALNFTILDAEHDKVFDAAIAGIPKVAEMIAAVPLDQRVRALDAAAQSYKRAATDLGYAEAEAEQWASDLMFRLSVFLRSEYREGPEGPHRKKPRPFSGEGQG